MSGFLNWFNQTPTHDLMMKAALAHLWFVTIPPFDDGNGRIARAITDMALERTQKGGLDVSEWKGWFLGCLHRAIGGAQDVLSAVIAKAAFWEPVYD